MSQTYKPKHKNLSANNITSNNIKELIYTIRLSLLQEDLVVWTFGNQLI